MSFNVSLDVTRLGRNLGTYQAHKMVGPNLRVHLGSFLGSRHSTQLCKSWGIVTKSIYVIDILRSNFFTTHGVHLQWRAPSASKNCLALQANQFFVFVAGEKIFAGDQTCQSFSVHVSVGHVWYMSVISWQTNQGLFLLYQDAVVEFDTFDFCSLLVIIETVWQNIAVHFRQPLPVFVHRPSVTYLHRFLKAGRCGH